MSERAAYSRVYWSIADDEKFADIYGNNDHLATWLRLLLIADQAFPASAHLPMNVRKGSREALVKSGLIDAVSGDRYRIHGLDAERGRRRDAATRLRTGRDPDGDQLGPKRDPDGADSQGRRRDEVETRLDETRWDAPETEALQWLAKHGCDIRPSNGYHRHLVTMVEVHGVNAVVGMFDRLASAGMKQGDTQGYVFGAKDALNAKGRPDLRSLERDEAAQERTAIRNRRIQEGMWARRIERFQQTGQWEPEWGEPPSKVTA
jgi:hypothetical protein